MTLNFLKRKKLTRPSFLLYHNLKHKQMVPRPLCAPLSTIPGESLQDIPRRTQQPSQSIMDEPTETQHRKRAMAHIEKLLYEISVSEQSNEFSRQRTVTIRGLLDEKTNIPKQDKPIRQGGAGRSMAVKNTHSDNSRPPLDVQELQTIAAMAKRIRTKAKVKTKR